MEEEGGCDDLDQGDNGWKIIHTDVFRFPPYKSLLCAVLGVGAQFLTLATGERSFPNTATHTAKRGHTYAHRGLLNSKTVSGTIIVPFGN